MTVHLALWYLLYMLMIYSSDSDATVIEETKKYLQEQFVTKDLGNLRYVLGIEVAHGKQGVVLSQRK